MLIALTTTATMTEMTKENVRVKIWKLFFFFFEHPRYRFTGIQVLFHLKSDQLGRCFGNEPAQ